MITSSRVHALKNKLILQQEDFRKIVNSRGVRENLFKLADADGSGDISVEEVIDFLVVLSKPRHTDDFDCDKIRRIEEVFRANLPPNQHSLTITEFKNIMPSKNAFFVERVFKIFDIDGDNTISLAEFLDKMYQYAGSQSDAEKVLFLFKVYDIDGKPSLFCCFLQSYFTSQFSKFHIIRNELQLETDGKSQISL